MQKTIPTIWFAGTADEAVDFYRRALPGASASVVQRYPTEGLPDFQSQFAGQTLMVSLEVGGFVINGINAGDEYRPTPAISFLLNFDPSMDADARASLDKTWAGLTDGGRVLMPLGEYGHSPLYGWVEDRFGVSWQVMLTNPSGEPRPFVIPMLTFGGPVEGRASEALQVYTDLFPRARLGNVLRFPHEALGREGRVQFGEFEAFGQWFAVMDAPGQDVTFGPGLSLQVACADQAELDAYWSVLSTVPEAEQCGWCTDRFGVSWQVIPAALGDLMQRPGAHAKLMGMKKIEIAEF